MKEDGGIAGGAIYRGEVVHKRLRPVEHKLRYRVFSLLLDVDRVSELSRRLRLFSLNRWNLFSVNERQHGARDGSSLSDFAWAVVRRAGLAREVKRIDVLLYPRILGFAFNPLTVYYARAADGRPLLMIYEVRNTFGENLTYVLPAGEEKNHTFSHSSAKEFYVSPFNDVAGAYDFHITEPSGALTVGVALKTGGKPLLRTHFRGTRTPLSDAALAKMCFAYPLMTLKVVAGIHVEAARLWRKGLRLRDRPPPPEQRISFEDDRFTLSLNEAAKQTPDITSARPAS